MFEPKDKRKLRALQQDGYLKRDNPLRNEVLATLLIASDTRPEWYEAFFTMDADGQGSDLERHSYTSEGDMQGNTVPLFQMLGRSDDGDGLNNPHILAVIVRRGLGARVKDIAAEVDMDPSTAGKVRVKWEEEIRALLQDARCLNLTGEDLYLAVSTPHYEPTRILQRLKELRAARTNSEAPGPLAAHYEEELRAAWFDYRIKAGLKGHAPDAYGVTPPHWFVNMLIGE